MVLRVPCVRCGRMTLHAGGGAAACPDCLPAVAAFERFLKTIEAKHG